MTKALADAEQCIKLKPDWEKGKSISELGSMSTRRILQQWCMP